MESGIEEEWEVVDYYPSLKEEGKEKCDELGWVINAGKKVLIGGIVVSCLPFILPPLVVILGLGLGLWVPYGVILGSYACTNKLMTKLLPSQDELNAGFDDGYRREERDGNLDIIINDDDVGINEGEEEKQQRQIEGGGTDVVKTEVLQEKIMVTEIKGEEKYENGSKEEERENLVQENNGEVKESGGKRRKKKKNIGGKRKEAPESVEQDSGTVKYYESTTTTIIAGAGAGAGAGKEENDIAPSQDQEALFGDEKIWEKIDAIREISGFKAPRRDSYYDELKALYLFTGIEAPSTSSDTPTDFPEFYSKLCFLMTVIGLK